MGYHILFDTVEYDPDLVLLCLLCINLHLIFFNGSLLFLELLVCLEDVEDLPLAELVECKSEPHNDLLHDHLPLQLTHECLGLLCQLPRLQCLEYLLIEAEFDESVIELPGESLVLLCD